MLNVAAVRVVFDWAAGLVAELQSATNAGMRLVFAYLQLAGLEPAALSDRSRLIITYALCGFANFGSLGIMAGGIAAVVPQRRAEIAGLGARAMVSGTLAAPMTAAVVGLITPG